MDPQVFVSEKQKGVMIPPNNNNNNGNRTIEKNRQKLQSTIEKTTITLMNPLRSDKKLLVVDLDHTILDFSNFEYDYMNTDSAKSFKRPYCDEFLSMVYEDYDIVVWSQTHWRWLEVKLTELGLLDHPNFKIAFVLDNTTMFTISAEQTKTKTTETNSDQLKEEEPETKKSKNSEQPTTPIITQTTTTTTTTTTTSNSTPLGDIFMNILSNVMNTTQQPSNTNTNSPTILNSSTTPQLVTAHNIGDILAKALKDINTSSVYTAAMNEKKQQNEKAKAKQADPKTQTTLQSTTTTTTTTTSSVQNEKDITKPLNNNNSDNSPEFVEMNNLLSKVLGDVVTSMNSGMSLISLGEKSKVKRKHRDGHEVKALEIIWSKFPQFSSKNTLHIDDLKRNFALNPRNGILIQPFRRDSSSANNDEELLKLALYLKEISTCDDFSLVDHSNWNSKK